MSEWHLIATAPIEPFEKVPSYYRFEAIVYPAYGAVLQAEYSYTMKGKGRWKTPRGTVLVPQPTHWMPLPAAPLI